MLIVKHGLTKRRGKRNGLSSHFPFWICPQSCCSRDDPYDPQRPSVPMCAGWNGHCAALLQFWSVRCDAAKFPIIYPDLRLDDKLAILPFERRGN